MIIIYILAFVFSVMTLGYSFQLIKAWIMELVYLWEKKHTAKEDQWIYKI